jgi:tRNA(Ile)-lysidine synthase
MTEGETAVCVDGLAARCRFPPAGSAVTCAVSGGADSMALLVLAIRAGCDTTAVHVDHGVRPDSACEADLVARAALRFGAAFRAERVSVRPGSNLEARMRAARYAVLPPDVLTGHTADDQAETVLLNLMRGSGTTGLAGMRPEGHPLLELRRRETRELCRALAIDTVDDPTNASTAHRRNRVRAELLPLMCDIAARDVTELICRAATVLASDDDALDDAAAALDPTDAVALAAAPVAVSARAVRRWLAPALAGYPPDFATVRRVLDVASGQRRACELPSGQRVVRSRQRLAVVSAMSPPPADDSLAPRRYSPVP